MIVLDTHIWFWINNDHQSLGAVRQEQIESAETIVVSAISCFEIAWLERHRRISLPCQLSEWFEKALSHSSIELLPITPAIDTSS
jgi:PIN domain nuclease of toxin-antitoxin system